MGCLSPFELTLRIKLGLKCISYHFSVEAIPVIVCPDVGPSCYVIHALVGRGCRVLRVQHLVEK